MLPGILNQLGAESLSSLKKLASTVAGGEYLREYSALLLLFSSITIFAYAKTKAADQLCSNCTADQRFCFRYTHSTIRLLLKYTISSF